MTSDQDIKISGPQGFKHMVHVDSDFRWIFDNESNPEDTFKKIKLIGKGGFGKVYQLLHTPSGIMLAGKIINPKIMNRQAREALKKEINLMKEISSPFTVRYCGCVNIEGSLMVLMEFCDQGSLRDLIDVREQPLTEQQIAFIIKDVLIALQFLHLKHHVIHRDIKAGNVLLTSKGQVKVTDFGVSRKFEAQGKMETRSQVGSPYWVAPEIINQKQYGAPADIWSLGATIVELAETDPPLFDLEPGPAMMQISTKGFPGLKEPEKFSEEFGDFVKQCMTFDPEFRPSIIELNKHPFLSKYNDLDRNEVLKPLLDVVIDYKALLEEEEEEDESDDFNFGKKTPTLIDNKQKMQSKNLNDSQLISVKKESTEKEEETNDIFSTILSLIKKYPFYFVGGSVAIVLLLSFIFGKKFVVFLCVLIPVLLYFFKSRLGI